MPLFNDQLDDEILIDASIPLSGVNNSMPPSVIPQTTAQDAVNRLTRRDGLNRPRPGIKRLAQVATAALDSIHHLGQGVFIANNGASWYKYDNRANVLSTLSGGPAYATGAQVYSALSNAVLYFSCGTTLDKYSVASGFGPTVPLPAWGPTALYPIWAVYRLLYAYQNTVVVSDALAPETFDLTGSVTLDPIASDVITGLSIWQTQQVVVFRNGSTWVIETGPGLTVPDWQVVSVSQTIGCRAHGTIVQTEADVLFLSETGRGVYALTQAPASAQQGVWAPVSADIQGYIDRINWAACDNARATYWNDLYILSVPLDGASFNNFCLIYSVSLGQWQGTWCFEIGEVDVAPRGFARDRTDPLGTQLMVATRDGIISRFTFPTDYLYFDQNIDGTQQPYDSLVLTRSFAFGPPLDIMRPQATINQIRPHSVLFQFLQSQDPVNITVIADRVVELLKRTTSTTGYLLQLTIPGFPFDLDGEGYLNVTLGLLGVGICNEIAFELESPGNWTLFQVKTTAFPSMPDKLT
jgi:hypothetical protein